MLESDRVRGRSPDRHVSDRRKQRQQPLAPEISVAQFGRWTLGQYGRWLVCVVGLAGLLLWAPDRAVAGHWPERNCLADAAHGGVAGIEYPDELWAAAQELAGHPVTRAKPRVVVAAWPEGHGEFGPARLGGCFEQAEWAVQVTPDVQANIAGFEAVLIHELTHAVLDDLGLRGPEHHCWMSDRNYGAQIIRWLYAHGHAMHLRVIAAVVLGDDAYLDQCRALGLRP